MSLSGALSSAISALNAQSSSLAMISDNISNSDTTGYKTTSAMFEQLVTASSSSQSYSSGGVSVSGRSNITQQGLLASTTNATDVAIQGSGFFVTANSTTAGGDTFYTRNGAFTTDNAGYLEDNGYYLEGWRTDASGSITGTSLEPINTKVALTNGGATTKTSISANLPADATSSSTFSSSTTVYDSLGDAHTLDIKWTKTAANTWTAQMSSPDGTISTTAPASDTYDVTFNNDGSLGTVTTAGQSTANPLSITWNNGAATSSITMDFGTTGGGTNGLTQLSSGSTTPDVSNFNASSDGISFGTLSSISVGKDGIVDATYSNGQTIPIYKIAVATFADPNGLVAHSGGMYTSTATSGDATLQTSGENGAGTIYGSELESSTTDTTGQFSNMISAQQAYSAASQVVTTVNKMFDTLISSMR
ncbi:putative flagellar hook protein FlgE [Bradyrhizobium sp. STM 3843]|uniref:flagellar hook protein FlgE n=1 Tax=Bradyrhizobium sp. STM 3843 TaxID=551947 RepID=UPI000240AE33|nr:flagellar hook protein FlgE [Bradyrhizobium sp. STM 3843]CCE05273.1 putative flagellar hook protein FlgE [Bradyrhizobium sp. STM 3843]